MNEQECLNKMVAPGTRRPGKYREGVIQIHVTRACDLACYNCTQASHLGGKTEFMSEEHFEQACLSLKDYFGVVGVFGGNPALSPHFARYCAIMREIIPFAQRGLWCNHPRGKGKFMRGTFNPAVSNLNVHLSQEAADEFKRDWPECHVVGLREDSRHSPPWVAMKDVLWKTCPQCKGCGRFGDDCSKSTDGMHFFNGTYKGPPMACIYCGMEMSKTDCQMCKATGKVYDESLAWELISDCPINKHWSAMIGVFRGQLRAWFCEIAGAQAMLHQDEPDYPDTGVAIGRVEEKDGTPRKQWWELPMGAFRDQVRKHCHECGVPLQGHGELAQSKDPDAKEQVSATYEAVYKLKRRRPLQLVTEREQLGKPLENMTRYIQNSKK